MKIKTHHWILLALAALLVVTLVLWPSRSVQKNNDELAGTWRGGGTNAEGYEWFMRYTFDNGAYTLTTDSGYSEEGTYTIRERFEDGSIIVDKTFDDGKKQFDMTILTDENPDLMFLEGVRMERE